MVQKRQPVEEYEKNAAVAAILGIIFWFFWTDRRKIDTRCLIVFKWANPGLFCLFLSSSQYHFNNTNRKKCRWCAWNLNLGLQDGRPRQNHGAMAMLESFFKWPNPGLFYRLFSVFSNKYHYNFYNKYMRKISIQYMVLGFKPMTFEIWVAPITTRPGLPPKCLNVCLHASRYTTR